MAKPTRQQPPDYYYRAYLNRRHPAHWFHRRRLDGIASLLPGDCRVLDAGCGSGVLSWILTKKGCRVTGLDRSRQNVDFARSLVPDGTFHHADLRQLSLDQRFEAVVCSDVLEHFQREERFLVVGSLARLVAPLGLLVVTVPSSSYFKFEPMWRLVRRLILGKRNWDDQAEHWRVGEITVPGFTTIRQGRFCLGLVTYLVLRCDRESNR